MIQERIEADFRDKAKEDLEREIRELRARLDTYEAQFGKDMYPYPSRKTHDHMEFFGGEHLLVAFVSDTHLGSKLCRYHDIDKAYKTIEVEGIAQVYHAGDLVDGVNVYRGQHNELLHHTFEDQKNDVVRNYPKLDKVKTFFITGNHDASFLKAVGADIGIAIAKERKDLVYLGQTEADIKISRSNIIRLWHPGGAGAYAKSYKQQRYIDSLEGGKKPHILVSGHYHFNFFMRHRNIYAIQTATFQEQSIYMKEKGLTPDISWWLAEFHIKDGSINRFKVEIMAEF